MTSPFAVIGRFSVRRRWLVLLLWTVAAVACVRLLPSIGQAVDNNNTQFLPASDPSNVAARLAAPFNGRSSNDDALVVAATANHRPLDAADKAAIDRLSAAAARLPHARSARVVEYSGDGQAAQIQVRASLSQRTNAPDVAFVRALRALFKEVGAPPGLVLHATGDLAITADQAHQAGGIGARTEELSIALIVLLLLAVFRSPLAPLATLLPAAVVLLMAESLVAGIARLGIGVSSITQLLLIVLVLGAGTDYGLFLVFRVREEVRRGLGHAEAVERAVERVGASIAFSAATVVAALLSLLLATFGVYHGLALPLSIGVALMVVAGVTLVPAVLAILGRALFWPVRPSEGQRASGAWGRLAGRVVRRPALALLAGSVVLASLAGFAAADRSSGFGGGIAPPPGSDSAAGQALLVKHFSSASTNPVELVLAFHRPIWSHPGALSSAGRAIEASSLWSAVIAPLDPNGTRLSPGELSALHRELGPAGSLPASQPTSGSAARTPPPAYQAYRATAGLVAPDGRTVQFLVGLKAGSPDSNAAISEVPAMRAVAALAAARSGASSFGVAGDSPSLYDVRTASSGDLFRLVPIAVLVIGLLLALLLRSLVAPLYLVVSVALSYLASLGTSVLVFEVFGGSFGLSFVLPFLMFVFLLALGEDYNILVMSRIREEAHGLPLKDAVVRAIELTGTTVTSAGLVLAGTFLVFAVAGAGGAEGTQVREIGIGLAVGIGLDTFVVRSILVPATVSLLGRWNWWPSALCRRQVASTAGRPAGSEAVLAPEPATLA